MTSFADEHCSLTGLPEGDAPPAAAAPAAKRSARRIRRRFGLGGTGVQLHAVQPFGKIRKVCQNSLKIQNFPISFQFGRIYPIVGRSVTVFLQVRIHFATFFDKYNIIY